MREKFFCILLSALSFLTVVVPNSFQIYAAITLFICAIYSTIFLKFSQSFLLVLGIFCASVMVTLFYMFVGFRNGAPSEAMRQTLIVYIISPMLWLFVCAAVLEVFGDSELESWVTIFSFLCIFSIGIFFYLFLNFGENSVSLFQDAANVDMRDGYIGATMHVYGSLIFLTGGFFASPRVVKNKSVRFALFFCFIVAALTSGRSALILSIPVGVFLGLIFLHSKENGSNKILNLFFLFFGVGALGFLFISASEINIDVIFNSVLEKLTSGGGDARSEQFLALMDGVKSSYWLGSGHGIGVDYLRNDEFPWRYELVWVATLLRVGVVGAVIYVFSFVVCVSRFLIIWRKGKLTDLDVFVFSGFLCALIASNTNPYIEGFVFQWMYIFPITYFLIKKSENAR